MEYIKNIALAAIITGLTTSAGFGAAADPYFGGHLLTKIANWIDPNVNEVDEHGFTSLQVAILTNKPISSIEKLIASGANVNATARVSHLTALSIAVRNNRSDIVGLLIRHGANPNLCDTHGNTPLHDAAKFGLNDIVALLITSPDINLNSANNIDFRGGLGSGPMFGYDFEDWKNCTPLHLAASYGRLDVVRQLISAGAEVRVTNSEGRTPEDLARSHGHQRVVEIIETHVKKYEESGSACTLQ